MSRIKITPALVSQVMPNAGGRAELYAAHLELARVKWVGEKPEHVAMWLAQLAHESGELRYLREIASGNAYEGRKDLGNTQPGDGQRFRGRGFIQLTGRDNYRRAGEALDLPLLEHPELLEKPEHAAEVSGWFWHLSGCGRLQDVADDPVLAVTKRINGGTNGLAARRAYYAAALPAVEALAAAPIEESQPVIVNEPAPAPVPAPERDVDHVELVSSLWKALQAGFKLARSTTWKKRQIAVNSIAGLLAGGVGISKALGYELAVDEDTLIAVGGLVWALVSMFDAGITATTTGSVGLPPRSSGGEEQRTGPGESPGL
jgi:putative chitinase